MKIRRIIIAFFITMVFVPGAGAVEWTPFQVSVWPPVQLFSDTTPVYGLRLNMGQGLNPDVWGVDAGMVNMVENRQRGVQAGLLNQSEDAAGINLGILNYTKRAVGLQVGLLNAARDHAAGLQVGGILNNSDHVRGLQIHAGILGNVADRVTGGQLELAIPLLGFNSAQYVTGIQVSLLGFNHVENTIKGLQIAIYNSAGLLKGLQIGLVNYSRDLSGFQIGIFNMVDREQLPMLPIINFGAGPSGS